MRRSDREVTERAAIDEIIRGCAVCHLGLAVDGEAYVVPISFGYDGVSVFFHTARGGRKIDMMAANPRVCVQFEDRVELVADPGDACGWTFSFASVIAFGTVVELADPAARAHGLNQIMRHYSGRDWSIGGPSFDSTRVWRLDVDTVTGKRSKGKD